MTNSSTEAGGKTPLRANYAVLKMWSERNKCWMCKHKFDKPIILPVEKPVTGSLRPNINVDVSVHMVDTHGMPTKDYVHNYVFNSIYGIENTMQNLYGESRMFKMDGKVLDEYRNQI